MDRRCVPSVVCEAAPWGVPGWGELSPEERRSIRSVVGKSRCPMTMTVQTLVGGYALSVNSWFSYQLIACGTITRQTLEQVAAHYGLNKRDYDFAATLLQLSDIGVQAVTVRKVHEVAIATAVEPASFESLPACINAVATRLNWNGHQIQLLPLDANGKAKLDSASGFRWVDTANVFYFIPADPAYLM